ncbi:hypothetical protein ES703_67894 [subsurface metagenome]
MWHGLIVDIPNGWALCDGENGTPDLRDRFVKGALPGVDPGDTGGSASHRHGIVCNTSYYDLAHTHEVDGNTGYVPAGDFDYDYKAGSYVLYAFHYHTINLTSQPWGGDHRHSISYLTPFTTWMPPHYRILFIMKL